MVKRVARRTSRRIVVVVTVMVELERSEERRVGKEC